MTILWQDIKYTLRMLARRPGFALIVVAILTIGIGANTAVFSVVNTVLLKALPYDAPGRIVTIREQDTNNRSHPRPTASRTLAYWREHNQVFDHVAGEADRPMGFTGPGESFRVSGHAVSPSFFSVVGVPPRLGRGFLPEEEQSARSHVMVVSHAFWRKRLGGDPQAIGRSLTADGADYTVVGVMPAGFRHDPWQKDDVTAWVPLVPDPPRADAYITAWGRLKRGLDVERARSDMGVLERQLALADPQTYGGFDVSVQCVLDWLGSERELLYPLWGAVALVLLIACLNVAGLSLVHGEARRQEMAMRLALGASRGRILSQLLTESLLLSLAAGALSVVLAAWIIRGIVALCPADVSQVGEARIDRTVLFFTLGLSVIVGSVFGVLPALQVGGRRPVRTLRGESSGPVVDRAWRRLSNGLVVAQIALAMTLLVGVGMLVQSLIQLQREDLGFQPKNVAIMHVRFPESKYPQGPQAAAVVKQLLQRVQSLPDVRSAAAFCGGFGLGSGGGFTPLAIEGRPPDSERRTWVRFQFVSPDFFATLGMRILRGRGFAEQNTQESGWDVIIDENLARRYFTREDPLGHRIALGGSEDGSIVGVVSTLRDYRALQPDIIAAYWPLTNYAFSFVDVIVRAEHDPRLLAPTLQAQVTDLDKDLEVSSIGTLADTLSTMLAPRRFVMVLMGVFAQFALVVAALGLYGLLQYAVSRRTHEIGVRMALGATRGRIIQTVLRQGGLLILTGAGLGLAGGYAMSQIVASLLYESKPTDPVLLAAVLITLLVTAFAACYVPARRAARVDPMVALRYE